MGQLRKKRNSFNEAAYLMNMIASLQTYSTAFPRDSTSRIELAIAIFKKIQKDNQEHIF